jgi:hypothetical protein
MPNQVNPPEYKDMILELTEGDIKIIKHDLIGCLNMNIHGIVLNTKQKTLSKLSPKMRSTIVDALFGYLSAYDKRERKKENVQANGGAGG